MTDQPQYKRVLLKISGESLLGNQEFGIDPNMVENIAKEVAAVHALGVDVGIVIGGGNIFRGVAGAEQGIDRVTGDYMGMLATVINGLALQSAFEKIGITARVLSAIAVETVSETYIRRRAMSHLRRRRVVIMVGGSGNPYFTTDTPAALRAAELNCDAIFKATKVDGVYTADPMKDKNAKRYESLTYMEALTKGLGVMDSTAFSLALENNIPILVFSLFAQNAFKDVLCGKGKYTLISKEGVRNDAACTN
jgi:uridylate kinase